MNVELDVHGLKCDNPNCDYNDMTIPVQEYSAWVNKPCPKCGENLLTEEDYNMTMSFLEAAEIANGFTPEELENITKSLSPEQMDSVLDNINELGLKKIGVDAGGREIWVKE